MELLKRSKEHRSFDKKFGKKFSDKWKVYGIKIGNVRIKGLEKEKMQGMPLKERCKIRWEGIRGVKTQQPNDVVTGVIILPGVLNSFLGKVQSAQLTPVFTISPCTFD